MRLAAASFLAAALASSSLAASAPEAKRAPRILPGERAELKTKDGWTLEAQYSAAKPGRLTFLLLHQAGGRKEDWRPLARVLAQRGFGFLAVDLRGHGGSQRPPEGSTQSPEWRRFKAGKGVNEWNNMLQDAEAAGAWLREQGVPEQSTALAGADVGSSVALKYAALKKTAPLLVMLSPGLSIREVLTVNAMRAYPSKPILLVAAEDDRRCATETAILFEFARRAAGPENAALLTVPREHGTRMLYVDKGLTTRIVDWIENPSRPPQEPAASTAAAPGSAARR